MEALIKILTLCLFVLLAGCSNHSQSITPNIFLEVKEIQKPIIQSQEDITKSYIQLFEAYEINLHILKSLQKLQK